MSPASCQAFYLMFPGSLENRNYILNSREFLKGFRSVGILVSPHFNCFSTGANMHMDSCCYGQVYFILPLGKVSLA